ncbi:MAG: ABC transporter ATP-binding protein, partial [Patescibacteria group bacterium]|nr:ABC transporter ATP-binding protein [Patescibacteria group bacterium]
MELIEIKNLKKIYVDGQTETPALCGVSFAVKAGEFVAIMGPSGSGKSTLLHMLGFLDRQSGGQYLFDGKTIDDYSGDELAHVRNRKMGFVFQSFNLLPRMTVLENVKLPLLYSDAKESEWDKLAKEAITAVDL